MNAINSKAAEEFLKGNVESENLAQFLGRVNGAQPDDDMFVGQVSDFQPYPKGVGLRYKYDTPIIQGYQDVVSFSDEFFLVVTEHDYFESFGERLIGDGWIVLHFRLSGATHVVYPELGEFDRRPNTFYIETLPDGGDRLSHFGCNDKLRSIAMAFRPSLIENLMRDEMLRLPDGLTCWVRITIQAASGS